MQFVCIFELTISFEGPIQVNISIFMFGFGNIEDKKSEFNFEVLMRIVWNDERLRPWNATIGKDKPMTVFVMSLAFSVVNRFITK